MMSLTRQYLSLACLIAIVSSVYGWLSSSPVSGGMTQVSPFVGPSKPTAFLTYSATRLYNAAEAEDDDDDDDDDKSPVDKTPREAAYEAADAVEEGVQEAKEKIDEDKAWEEKTLYEKTRTKAGDAKDYVKDKAGDAKDYVKDKAGVVKDKAVAVKDALLEDEEDKE